MNRVSPVAARRGTGTIVAAGLLPLLAMLALPVPAAAATCTWTGVAGDARWSTVLNWTGCPGPVTGDTLVFPAGAPPVSVNDIVGLGLAEIRIDGVGNVASYVISGLSVFMDGASRVVSLADFDANGDGVLIALDIVIPPDSANTLQVEVGGGLLTMTGAITGHAASRVNKDGPGLLILGSPSNAWDLLEIAGGRVQLDAAGALPANSLLRIDHPAVVLDLNDFDATIRELIALFGGTLGGPFIDLGSATLTVNGSGEFDGRIGGTGNLVKSGAGTLTLGGAFSNSYIGTTTVNGGTLTLWRQDPAINGPVVINGGTLRVDSPRQIADQADVTINSPGVLVLNSFDGEVIGSIAGNGTVNIEVGTLTVGANGRSTTFAGSIGGLYGSEGRVSLSKVGAGTLALTGAHTYRGSTRLEAGTLFVNGSIAAGDYNTVEVFGGTFGGVGTLAQGIYAPSPETAISPGTSPGILHVTSAYLRGRLLVEINGPIAGSGYDQLDVTAAASASAVRTLDLTGATLQVSLAYNPPAGTQFTIVKLPAGLSHAPVGTFTGLPEGAELVLRDQRFGISYRGGSSGNGVVLTALEDPPTLSIDDVTVTEGHAGATPAMFTVALSKPLSEAVSVQYAIASGSATAGADYAAESGTVVFLPTATTQTITVGVVGDRDVEPDETFVVRLSGLSGPAAALGVVTIARAEGTGTIVNDDGVRTYYLSEGSTGGFFDEDILIANPNATIAPVTLTFLKEDGAQVVAPRSIAAWSHVTVHADLIPGLESAAASVTVTSESGVPLMVERTMFWDATYRAGHTGSSVEQPAQDWLFAEGSQGFFSTFLLVANPHATPTDVTFTFLPEDGEPVVVSRTVGPTTRLTLSAGDVPALIGRSFGVAVHATQPIMAERSMYFGTTPADAWSGGTESAGVTGPSTHWFLAEGATGSFFDTFILLSNPQDAPAHVTVQYLLDAGEPITVAKVVPARGRLTIPIESESDPRLHNAAVSTVVTSDQPIVAERSMYWAAWPWHEAHNSFGVAELGTRWALAEGRVGGARRFQTYVLLANPQTEAAHVTVTYLRKEGAPLVRQSIVPPTSRFNIDVNAVVPEMRDESFGTLIEVTNGVPIAVERSMYWDAQGRFWSGGTNATGMRVP